MLHRPLLVLALGFTTLVLGATTTSAAPDSCISNQIGGCQTEFFPSSFEEGYGVAISTCEDEYGNDIFVSIEYGRGSCPDPPMMA